jgi:hypothetical protein
VDSDHPASDERERDRRRLERLFPELVKRLVEVGYEKLSEGPENVRTFVNELKLPREVIQAVTSNLEETKNTVARAVSREVREFLERASLSEELTKVLTGVSLEVKTEVRFVPQDKHPRPEVRSEVKVNADGRPNTEPPKSEEER